MPTSKTVRMEKLIKMKITTDIRENRLPSNIEILATNFVFKIEIS